MEVVITLRVNSIDGSRIDKDSFIALMIAAVKANPNLNVKQVAFSDVSQS